MIRILVVVSCDQCGLDGEVKEHARTDVDAGHTKIQHDDSDLIPSGWKVVGISGYNPLTLCPDCCGSLARNLTDGDSTEYVVIGD